MSETDAGVWALASAVSVAVTVALIAAHAQRGWRHWQTGSRLRGTQEAIGRHGLQPATGQQGAGVPAPRHPRSAGRSGPLTTRIGRVLQAAGERAAASGTPWLALAGWDEQRYAQWLQRHLLRMTALLVAGLLLAAAGNARAGLLLMVAAVGLLRFGGERMLRSVAERRQRQLNAALPAFLDRFTLASRAGLTTRQALRVAAARAAGPLGELLARVIERLDLGASLPHAVQAELDGVQPGPTRLTLALLAKSEQLGVALADVAEQQSGFVRQFTEHQLQQRIEALPTQLMLCAMFLLMPPVFVVVLMPNLLMFLRSGW